MAKSLTTQDHIETLNALKAARGNASRAALAIGMNRNTYQARLAAARAWDESGVRAEANEEIVPIGKMTREQLLVVVSDLKAAVKSAKQETLDDEFVKSKIIGLSNRASGIEVPTWVTRDPHAGDHGNGTPTVMLSDFHWGEVVRKQEINGVNEYDLAIAQRRLRKLVERTVDLGLSHIPASKGTGIVVQLGGDMLSGDIHQELQDTNELPTMPAMLDLFGCLVWALTELADRFGRVFVPCVTGNHGRNSHKPRAKRRNHTNFDWLLYQMLAKHFEANRDDRLTFAVGDGPDVYYTLHGHRYCLTHGDAFKGGDGIIGALGPITRGDKRKRARNSTIGMEYDTLCMGHWHQYIPLRHLIVNGTLKGPDEFSMNILHAPPEPPTQALFWTHPTRGITFNVGVQVDGAQRSASEDWVRFKVAA